MIKRIRLYREGVPTVDGRLLVETTWDPPPLPLMRMPAPGSAGHEGSQIIGTVDHIHRGRDGWVTGVIKTPADPEGLFAEADFAVERIEESGDLLTMNARLRAVTLGTRPAWKEMTRT